MRRIGSILESCAACSYFGMYGPIDGGDGERIFVCRKQWRLFAYSPNSVRDGFVPIPDWCPLEPYPERDVSSESAMDSATEESGTGGIVLIGMPHLEWAPDNLTGHGGTEVDGRWYYTWEQAKAAAEEVGDGWRLPTADEFEALAKLGSEWDDDRNGRVFGGGLYLQVSGYRNRSNDSLESVGTEGGYWSSSPTSGLTCAGNLYFYAMYVNPLDNTHRALGLSVRLVRDVK